jgi:hypothetical protein
LKIEKLRNDTGIASAARIVRLTLLKVMVAPLLTKALLGVPGFNFTAVAGGIRIKNIRVSNIIDILKLPSFFIKSLFIMHSPSTYH